MHILRIDPIKAGSILITYNLVTLKRENHEPILIVKITEWRKFISCFGIIFEADPYRVGKKNVYFSHIGSIPNTSSGNPHISRQQLDKEYNLEPPKLRLYKITKSIASKIAPHICSVLRDIQLGRIFCHFCRLSLKMYCIDLASPLLYIPKYVIQIRVYIVVFHDITFSYYLIATRNLTFGHIKWTPDITLTHSFPDILFVRYSRQGMGGEKCHQNAELFLCCLFRSAIFPMVSCLFCEKLEAVM